MKYMLHVIHLNNSLIGQAVVTQPVIGQQKEKLSLKFWR